MMPGIHVSYAAVSFFFKNHKPHTCIHSIKILKGGSSVFKGGKLRGWGGGGGGGMLPVFWFHQEHSRATKLEMLLRC